MGKACIYCVLEDFFIDVPAIRNGNINKKNFFIVEKGISKEEVVPKVTSFVLPSMIEENSETIIFPIIVWVRKIFLTVSEVN